jgi:hypothetical protein
MSAKGALLKVATAAAVVSVGTAVVVATTTPASSTVPSAAISRDVPPAAAPNLVAAPSQPKTTLHLPNMLHLIAKAVSTYGLSGGRDIYTVQLSNRSRHLIGSGVLSCQTSSADASLQTCESSLGLAGGIMLFRATVNFHSETLSGTVTGGSGDYAGANGTIKGAARSNGTIALTATYT